MKLLKRYCKANSIIESVIALSIISICIYIVIMVYAQVFSPKTSVKQYANQNQLLEKFYLMQLGLDYSVENIETSENWINTNLKEVQLEYLDSISVKSIKKVYIYVDEE